MFIAKDSKFSKIQASLSMLKRKQENEIRQKIITLCHLDVGAKTN